MAENNEGNIGQDENIGSFYMGRMRPPPEPKRFLPPGVLTLLALAVLGGIVWYAYPCGARNADVPVIRANNAPIKSAPASPGGMNIPYQNSTAFNPLVKGSGKAAEKLTPPPAQPVDKTAAIAALQSKMSAPAKLDMDVKKIGNGVEELVPPPPVARPPVTVASLAQKKAETPKIVFAAPAKAPVKVAVKTEAKAAVAKKTAAAKTIAAKTVTPVADAKDFMVQLGSYRARADAKAYWEHTRPKFVSALRHLDMRIVKADIPGRGIYYRLQAGPVAKDKGDAICAKIRAGHRPCILARR